MKIDIKSGNEPVMFGDLPIGALFTMPFGEVVYLKRAHHPHSDVYNSLSIGYTDDRDCFEDTSVRPVKRAVFDV